MAPGQYRLADKIGPSGQMAIEIFRGKSVQTIGEWINSFGLGVWDGLAFVSYSLFALSYTMRDIRWLRIISIVAASIDLLIYFYVRPGQPMWVQVVFSGVLIGINAYQLYALWRDTQGSGFEGDIKFLYESVFSTLTPGEFRRLVSIGSLENLEKGHCVLRINHAVEAVAVLAHGELAISREGNILTHILPGAFIGEMGYITENPASVNVTVSKHARLLCFPITGLKTMEISHPELHAKLTGIMGRDIVEKLRSATLLAHKQSQELHDFRASQFVSA